MVIETLVIYARDNPNCDGGNDCSRRLRGFRMEILNVVDGNESVVHTYDDTSPINPGHVISLPIPTNIVGNKVRISIPGRTGTLELREVQVFSSVGCFDVNGDANNRICQAPNLKVAYYEANDSGALLPVDGLLSLVPYQTDLDFDRNAIRMEATAGEVFTSGRSQNVAARFVGYTMIENAGSYSICINSDDESKLYIDGALIVGSTDAKGRECATVEYAEAEIGVKRVEVEYTADGTGNARCLVEWMPPGGIRDDLPFITSSTPGLAYGDNFHIQLNSKRWLSGNRSGNGSVVTYDHYRNKYEITNDIVNQCYKWTVLHSDNADPSSIDSRHGETVKYGDEVFLHNNYHSGPWLRKNPNSEALITRELDGESNNDNFKWIIRSSVDNADYLNLLSVSTDRVVYFQNKVTQKWLVGTDTDFGAKLEPADSGFTSKELFKFMLRMEGAGTGTIDDFVIVPPLVPSSLPTQLPSIIPSNRPSVVSHFSLCPLLILHVSAHSLIFFFVSLLSLFFV